MAQWLNSNQEAELLKKLMKISCKRQCLSMRQIRLRFHGQPINETFQPTWRWRMSAPLTSSSSRWEVWPPVVHFPHPALSLHLLLIGKCRSMLITEESAEVQNSHQKNSPFSKALKVQCKTICLDE